MPDDSEPQLTPELEDALASLHERGDRGPGLDDLCRRHPAHAELLRAVHARLQQIDPPPTKPPGRATDIPSHIGPYRIQSELGRGGMGVVYLAEQEHPVRQLVALKVIRKDGDPQFLRRFAQERQALALMHHDGIAKVHRCDTTADGHPYIAMEYVRGVPLTAYCDQRRLDVKARVQLLQQICSAVTHAHQKGIVHRDLKPANILVTDEGRSPRVKIIDFGLAKPVGMALTGALEHTGFGQILGTLAYMAPEQADLTSADVDTRADIYSLGVILHELLVGRPPMSSEELLRAGFEGMRRLLRERDPRPPSTRITQLGDCVAIARQRRQTVPGLQRTVRGDLDWAVLKALEPDRSRRYSTADALADDLQRWLDHEPLQAGPPGSWYRLRKLLRRHRGQFTAASAVLVTAILGAVGALREAAEADRQRAAAVANLSARQVQILLGEASQLRRIADEDLWWTSGGGPDEAALQTWLTAAARLREVIAPLANELAELRRNALPQTPAEAAAQKRAFARSVRLEVLQKARDRARDEIAKSPAPRPLLEAALAGLEPGIRRLERELDELRTWRLPDPLRQARHDELALALRSVADFADEAGGELGASVRTRLATVRRFAEQRLAAEAAWEECRAAAQPDEAEAVERLAAVPGLVPLGRDPTSGRLEFCAGTTGTVPPRAEDGALQWQPECGLVLVLLPAGTAELGAQAEAEDGPRYDPNAERDEKPREGVPLAAFLIGKHEVHQGAWLRMTGSNPSNLAPDAYGRKTVEPVDLGHPVEQVSWQQCWETLRRHGLRLPTEAQWEYAARGGTDSAFWMEQDPAVFAASANVSDRTVGTQQPWEQEDWTDGWLRHAPVTTFRANPFGLHHVHGNLWEWCLDDYDPGAYQHSARPGDGLRLVTSATRVARGGTFGYPRSAARSANRHHFHPEALYFDIGVRAAMDVPGR